jgi:hypothetical protein
MPAEPRPEKPSLQDEFLNLQRRYELTVEQFRAAPDGTTERLRLLGLMAMIVGELDAVTSELMVESEKIAKKPLKRP